AADRNADAFAEKAALHERSTLEHATIGGIGAVEPERQCNAVAEQEIDLAAAQRLARGFRIGIGTDLHLGEEGLEIGLMRGLSDDRDLAALQVLGPHVLDLG